MIEFIKKISLKSEFIIVITIAFGYSIFSSLIIFLTGSLYSNNSNAFFTNANLLSTVFYDIIIMTILYEFLHIRESLIELKNNLSSLKLLFSSLLLVLIFYFIYYLLVFIVFKILPHTQPINFTQITVNQNLNISVIIAISIVNSIFEETIVVGYIISKLRDKKGVFFAINVSILVRFLYHLYQGPMAALSIIPLGILFAFVYVKWKNIWPLIIAHIILDILGLYLTDL